jgi:hypothetical protein
MVHVDWKDSEADGERHIIDHLPCVRCGYDLHTLARDSRCPECSTPVADSLIPGPLPLDKADAGWLGDLALGCALLVVAGLLPCLGWCYRWVAYDWLGYGYGKYGWNASFTEKLILGLQVSAQVLSLYGLYLLGRREPVSARMRGSGLLPGFLRLLAWLNLASNGIQSDIVGLFFWKQVPPSLRPVLAPLIFLLMFICLIALIITTPSIYLYMRRLLARSPFPSSLRREATWLVGPMSLVVFGGVAANITLNPSEWPAIVAIGNPGEVLNSLPHILLHGSLPNVDVIIIAFAAIPTLWALLFWARSARLFLKYRRMSKPPSTR